MRVPFARFKAPSIAPPPGQAPSCANCSAPLAVGQDWCLECGTAMPGRYGRGPGLRSSLGVVGVTLLLVVGAVAAAYAALSADSKQATQTIATTPATPLTADVPATAAGTTTAPAIPATPVLPNAATPTTINPAKLPAAPKLPAATPTPAAAPTPATPAPSTPATTTKPKKTTTTGTSTTGTPAAQSAKILLDTDAASTYNPYSLAPGGFGDPAKAIDDDPSTSWTYQLDPSTGGKTLVGVAINLKSAQRVRSITLSATPGMTVEFYGATGSEPVSITDPGWLHLASRRAITSSTTVTLKTGGRSLDYLLVWITHAPAGMTTGTLGISELSVAT